MTQSKLVTLLAKLQALADNPGTPHEGEVAKAKIASLRQRHAGLLPPPPAPQRSQWVQSTTGSFTGWQIVRFTVFDGNGRPR